jgi:hypothetical protein
MVVFVKRRGEWVASEMGGGWRVDGGQREAGVVGVRAAGFGDRKAARALRLRQLAAVDSTVSRRT